MHRQCRIIHTDFKPENVVIGLRDEEVAEIAQTGQLTTTKMFDGADHNRKLNMRVAGTLPTNGGRVNRKAEEKKQQESEEEKAIELAKQMEGMTAKQKKNFRKKQARKRKKAEQSRITHSQLDVSEEKAEKYEEEEGDLDIDLDINIDVDLKAKEVPKKKQANMKHGS